MNAIVRLERGKNAMSYALDSKVKLVDSGIRKVEQHLGVLRSREIDEGIDRT